MAHVEIAEITIDLDGHTAEIQVVVEEYHPVDRAAYQEDSGWTCFDGDTEYFVSTSGIVYLQPDNDVVGIAHEIKTAADKWEAQMAEAMDHGTDPDEEIG